jgi:hypothetical protein
MLQAVLENHRGRICTQLQRLRQQMWSQPPAPILASLLLMALSLGCHSWQVQPASPQQVMQQQPRAVQVRQSDGTRFILAQPELGGDTLSGFRAGAATRISLDRVDRIALRKFSTGKTTLLIASIPVGLLGLVLLGCATSNCGY